MKKKIVVMLTGVFAASMLLSGCEASKGLETDNLTITHYKVLEVYEYCNLHGLWKVVL